MLTAVKVRRKALVSAAKNIVGSDGEGGVADLEKRQESLRLEALRLVNETTVKLDEAKRAAIAAARLVIGCSDHVSSHIRQLEAELVKVKEQASGIIAEEE